MIIVNKIAALIQLLKYNHRHIILVLQILKLSYLYAESIWFWPLLLLLLI